MKKLLPDAPTPSNCLSVIQCVGRGKTWQSRITRDCCYFLFPIFAYASHVGSLGLRITGLSVPSEVQVGGDVFLQCHFDLEGSNLYALKWYKGQHGTSSINRPINWRQLPSNHEAIVSVV